MNYIIREIKMPLTIRAFTLPDANGEYNIYINMDLSDEAKKKTLAHEMKHIKRNDFNKDIPVKLIEQGI
jgi:Zn-dependent peptidase ImmA (M78 family)